PVKTVQVEVHVSRGGAELAHVTLGVAGPGIANVAGLLDRGAKIVPAPASLGAKDNGVEAFHGKIGKELVLELRGTVLPLEHQPKGVLHAGRVRAPTIAEDPDATVHLDALSAVWIKELHGAGPLPGISAAFRVGVNSAGPKKIRIVHDDGERGNAR